MLRCLLNPGDFVGAAKLGGGVTPPPKLEVEEEEEEPWSWVRHLVSTHPDRVMHVADIPCPSTECYAAQAPRTAAVLPSSAGLCLVSYHLPLICSCDNPRKRPGLVPGTCPPMMHRTGALFDFPLRGSLDALHACIMRYNQVA